MLRTTISPLPIAQCTPKKGSTLRKKAIDIGLIPSHWPLVITLATMDNMQALIHALIRFSSILKKYFDHFDIEKRATMAGFTRQEVAYFKHFQDDQKRLFPLRYDIMISNNRPYIIEINTGGALGGVQTGLGTAVFHTLLGAHIDTAIYYDRIAHLVEKYSYSENSLMVVDDTQYFKAYKHSITTLKNILAPRLKQKVTMGCVKDIKKRGECFVANGNVIGTSFARFGIDDMVKSNLQDYKNYIEGRNSNKFHEVVDPIALIYSSKAYMAYLYEAAQSDTPHLTEDEKKLVLDLLPQTLQKEKLGAASYDHVLKNKNEYFLKKALDFAGKGVLCGWQQTQQEWEANLLAADNYDVIQKRVISEQPRLNIVDTENKMHTKPASYVLGIHIWDSIHVGTCIRADMTDNPVINMTYHAAHGVIFEL